MHDEVQYGAPQTNCIMVKHLRANHPNAARQARTAIVTGWENFSGQESSYAFEQADRLTLTLRPHPHVGALDAYVLPTPIRT